MTARHAHLDPVGGIAGDMFVAACLDAFPEWCAPVENAVRAAGLPPSWALRITRATSASIAGTRLQVLAPDLDGAPEVAVEADRDPGHDDDGRCRGDGCFLGDVHDHRHALEDPDEPRHGHAHHDHDHDDPRHRHVRHDHDHDDPHHRHERDHAMVPTGAWRDIRDRLRSSDLDPAVQARAIDIFERLAIAEATVHGVAPDDVHFHELADWDSVADIVAAAWCIERIGAGTWSIGPLPLGGGTVRTAHGVLPVPAPAVALLLSGRLIVDDGVGGERVTPTGAAIVAHLEPIDGPRPPGAVAATGHGLGTRTLPDRANLVRLLLTEPAPSSTIDPVRVTGDRRRWDTTTVTVVEFEVDDQIPEDLALGVEAVRSTAGVLDVVQAPVFGKKGRIATAVRVLVRPEHRDEAIAAVFEQTTTIGVRSHDVGRAELPRSATTVDGIAAKRVERPSGASTIKAESDAVAAMASTQAERTSIRATLAAAHPTDVAGDPPTA